MASSSITTTGTAGAGSQKKVAVVTGANKGIGLETARQLATLGYTVVIGSRDKARGAAAAAQLVAAGHATADWVELDVTNQASIDAAAAYVKGKHGHVDALVNNAGVGGKSFDPTTLSVAEAKETFDTNFFGVIGVTTAFLPLVRAAGPGNGRIVMVSSLLGSLGERARPSSEFLYKFTPTAYDTSKAAVNMYTLELAQVLKAEGIKVNTSHPGLVKTDMNPTGLGIEVAEGSETSVWLATLPADGPTGGFFHKQIHLQW